jgi:hypothetical protein
MSNNSLRRFFPLTSVSIISRVTAACISLILSVIVPKITSAQQLNQEHISNLLPRLNIDKGEKRQQIIAELDYLGKDAIPELIGVLKDDYNSVNFVATKGLQRIDEAGEKELIKQLQNSANTKERWSAIALLDNQGLSSPKTADMFAKALILVLADKAQPNGLRIFAANALDFIEFEREERSKYQQSIFGNKLLQNQWVLILGGTLISFLLICRKIFSKYSLFQSKQV